MIILAHAYLAGVLDSDGSLSISKLHKNRKSPTYQCMFQLSWVANNRTEIVLNALVHNYGGSFCKVSGKAKGRFKNGKPYYKYCLTGQKLKTFLLDIQPFVLLKRQQVSNLLEILNFTKQNNLRLESSSIRFEELYLDNKLINSKNKPERLCA